MQLRARVREINADLTLSESEKAVRRQQVLMQLPVAAPAAAPNDALTCTHYRSKKCARFSFVCCGGQVRDPCHRCHSARGCCSAAPPRVASLRCNECDTEQMPGAQCVNPACGTVFAPSYCAVCFIWTDMECFHCDACGVCRVGRREDMFHCETCDACFSAATRARHRCAKSALRDAQCPICLESVHDAQKTSHILPCGHVVHGPCWRESARRGEYRCPTCRKSLIDMRRVWAMLRENVRRQPIPRGFFSLREGDLATAAPFGDFRVTRVRRPAVGGGGGGEAGTMYEGEFVNWRLADGRCARGVLQEAQLEKKRDVAMYCFDCETRGTAPFHFVGIECGRCGSFNTSKD